MTEIPPWLQILGLLAGVIGGYALLALILRPLGEAGYTNGSAGPSDEGPAQETAHPGPDTTGGPRHDTDALNARLHGASPHTARPRAVSPASIPDDPQTGRPPPTS